MKNCWLIGASSGIGFELAKKLCANGYNVVISSRSFENLSQLKETVLLDKKQSKNPQQFGEIHIEIVDVASYENVKKSWQSILNKFEKIDLAIFASALYERMNLENFDIDFAKKTMDINFNGFLNFLHVITPEFFKNKSGHIATIASVAGYRGLPQSFCYGASKSAIINLCEGIYPELRANNIDISVINPGFVKTRLTEKNNFDMPFIISAQEASSYIYKGLMAKKFEIHFPKKFTLILKFLRIIPYRFYLFLINKIYQKNISK
ncbi:MAG: SDR family NAD(P)-dependent oxidoreductase [Alphaproteobacteria bacterium]|nr:SDR family NAD(P)-dependent oxidoreductase [Alphaproteobacteria bacterium]